MQMTEVVMFGTGGRPPWEAEGCACLLFVIALEDYNRVLSVGWKVQKSSGVLNSLH